ncbi:MAG TPA: RIP metalloprotease RseP [Rhizomicrobium sp.]|jgi:regulator of sigma E protease|nr:RIP metalloprotease RseP [Rhizomicrobium sp.]
MLDALRSLVLWTPLGLPAFLFVITLVVFFHELGHFLVARACGVKVDVFSVGFGREIFGWTDKSGTRWKISWLPVGGYVKFAGDANAASIPDRVAESTLSEAERVRTLAFKPVWQRAAVAAAGPFANFILAIFLFTGVILHNGHTVVAPIIGDVVKGSPAEAAGIKAGDRVSAIDGTRITDFEQMPQIIAVSGGQTLAIDLIRAGRPLSVHVMPHAAKMRDVLGDMGTNVVIGVRPSPKAPITTEYYSVPGAFGAACVETWDIIHTTVQGVAQMVRGYASADQLRGPLGIAKMTRQVAVYGFLALLQLAAVLSVSIGFANLFPIPLLDGGHLLYYACEAVLGRPLGERAQDVGFRLGLVLVLGLVLLTTWNDLARLNLF